MNFIKSIINIFSRNKTSYPPVLPGVNYRRMFDNLLSTKHYCDLQLKQFPEKSPTTIFRTYNPVIGTANLFDFETVEIWGKKLLQVKWNNEPLCKVPEFFFKQLEYKNNMVKWEKSHDYFKGKMIITDYDLTVVDGASEHESNGFFDGYDLPPIDTWVYLAPNKEGRTDLYAWVPEPYISLAQKAIDVNCVDMIRWLE